MPPRVTIQKTNDRQSKFGVQSLQESTNATRWLSRAFGQNAVVLFPEAIFVESTPHRVFFDVKDEVRLTLHKLNHIRLADRWDGISARPHTATVNFIPCITDRDVADHGATLFGKNMQFFPQRTQQHLKVLQDGVGFILITKCLFFGACNGVQALVIHAPKTQGFVLLQQLQHPPLLKRGLHEFPRLSQIEQFSYLGAVPHAKNSGSLIPLGVGIGTDRYCELRIFFSQSLFGKPTRFTQNRLADTSIPTCTSPTGGFLGRLLSQLLHFFGHHRRARHRTAARSSSGLFPGGFTNSLLLCHGSATPSGRCVAKQGVIV